MVMFNYELMKKLCSTFDKSYGVKMWKNGKLIYDSTKSNVSPKPNNNAPKTIKGDYDLSIHGNKIVLVDNRDGTTVEAKCHPDDNFDIGNGIKKAFKKMNEKREEIKKAKEEEDKKIKVGDWVEVVNCGQTYSTYPEWLYDKVNFEYIRRYCYNYCPSNSEIGRVVAVGTHEIDKERILVAFETKYKNVVYIVNQKGLKKVAKPNQ